MNLEDMTIEHDLIIKEVLTIRKKHKAMGTRKLFELLQPFVMEHQIKIGRDRLFDLLSQHQLLVKKRKRRIATTMSYHRFHKYPNLIRELVLSRPNQLWVSDITYWKLHEKHAYISLITDAYSHKIVGYQVAETLEAVESIQALQMAFSALGGAECHLPSLTHHSDRGVQYCSFDYVKLLNERHVKISMTENGDPLENAIAERVNGILKSEYLEYYDVNNMDEAKELLKDVIALYNNERPHMSIGNLTPNQVHHSTKTIKTEKLWKNYYQKKTTFVNQEQDY
jgi:transposase InsO family protein